MPDTPIATSESMGWTDLKLSGWEGVSPQEAFEPELNRHLLVLHRTPGPVRVFERADGYRGDGVARPGDINLFSAGDLSFCRWEENLSFIRLDLSPALTDRVAAELELPQAGGGAVDLSRRIRLRDDRVSQIVQWLYEDLNQGGLGGKLYADSLARMLAVHLLHRYGVASERPERRKAGPSRLARRQLDGALQYVHAHLGQDISLEKLAAAAHVSASHLVRLFREATGLAPHQYVIRERIRRAQAHLEAGLPIQEVAAALGFSDQSHLHRHFKRIVGVTPREYARGLR
ncbi:helix-turn-helix transcriptional regulator [Cohnella xylanilytica]|uniref:Helix-turn-helix transcriptional regulator n=1 Tax=Cohnella xylanilytica TaxID=557555 RepID=A0A841U657_9BACL|nr:AraC family transcriptional regulator [Cohnella xylanilytica]MBB6695122.1 helix-turn-helix transcriptional regulator [Cohnella xylanilytica]